MTIKDIRNSYGCTQKQLAERTNIPLRSIQDLEADRVMHLTTTRVDYFKAIADAFNMTMDELYNLIK